MDKNKLIQKLKEEIENSEYILIGAGAGLSTSAGFLYDGKRFEDNFKDYIKKYGFTDMYSAGFYNFPTLEEYWAYFSLYVYINRYDIEENKTYLNLCNIVKNKNYFVITTNVDGRFADSKFDKDKIFAVQGDFSLFQCSKPCMQETFYNEKYIREMIKYKKLKLQAPKKNRITHKILSNTINMLFYSSILFFFASHIVFIVDRI